MKKQGFILAGWILFSALVFGAGETLRVLTVNMWSGLDYQGTARFGTYEAPADRAARFQSLLSQVRDLAPDLVFLQEVNPCGRMASRLARRLGYTEIHQYCIAGIKLGPLGVPVNCREGNAILARPRLRLAKEADWKLSGTFGLFGGALNLQVDQAIFALLGSISVNGRRIYLVNTHLVAAPPPDAELERSWKNLLETGAIAAEEHRHGLKQWRSSFQRQETELARLAKKIKTLPVDAPLIVAGDFNAPPASENIVRFRAETGLLDTFVPVENDLLYSWDPVGNANIRFSTSGLNAAQKPERGYGRLCSLYDTVPRRIDYIFLNRQFPGGNAVSGRIVLAEQSHGAQASDHYAALADIRLPAAGVGPENPAKRSIPLAKPRLDPFPILMYDTDIGVGYGAKLFLLNQIGRNESFDLTLFNSSKGERWYRFVISLPDFELRQGRTYPLALDLTIDYDKYIRNNFFGIGSAAKFGDREYYTREPLEISLSLSRGFSPRVVAQSGLRFKTIRNFNFAAASRLAVLPGELNTGRASYVSLFLNLRYDSRDSFINPSRGTVIQGEAEVAPGWAPGNIAFSRLAFWHQFYAELFYPKTIFAWRFWFQSLAGNDLPVQVLLPLGGNITLRGSPQDRYLDKTAALVNAEIRFPVLGRLGGVAGLDLGKVWHAPADIDLRGWAVNPTLGLRFYMKTYVVRLDVGFGREATGLYFNFGHIF
jgi:endonuclease/exonuclease/phosphatase family metal-dependent hydrolase